MKILLDGRLYGLENAGLGRYVVNLVAGLTRLDRKNQYVILLPEKYFKSLNLPSNWKKIKVNLRHYSLAEQIIIPKIIKKENPDIVHFPHFNVPMTFKGKFIVTIHDLLMHKNTGLAATTLPAPIYFLKRLGYKTVFKSAVTHSKKIIVPSTAVKKEVVDYYKVNPNKIRVIYEGVDVQIKKGKNINQKYNLASPYFVYAGNAYPHKNLKRLIEATILLNKKGHKATLAIASARNVFTKRLESLVSKLKASRYVKLLGFVPDTDLGSLFENSKAFVFPSLSEGFGLPGLEAMASGTLVLASDIPVFKEIYEGNAFYFDPMNVDFIKEAMEKAILMDNAQRNKAILKGKDFVKRYSWDKMARETLTAYGSVVN